MKRSIVETVLGAVVLIAAALFLTFGYKKADLSAGSDGYEIVASFSGIGGLKPGDDVQISGVKVGKVTAVELDDRTYLARVIMNVASGLKLPADTAALISSESLLGGKYLALEPGSSDEFIEAGGVIEYTQAPQNLEQLLGQFIFSMQDDGKKKGAGDAAASEPEAGEPGVDESASEGSVSDQPAAGAPLTEEPAAEEPVTPEPEAASEPATVQPQAGQPAVDEWINDQPVPPEPASEAWSEPAHP